MDGTRTTLVTLIMLLSVLAIASVAEDNPAFPDVAWTIRDSSGRALAVQINLLTDIEPDDDTVAAASKGAPVYDAEITFPGSSSIKSLSIKNLNHSTAGLQLRLDEVPLKSSTFPFKKIYAIDPSNLSFDVAYFSSVAKGSYLYKCEDWDFANKSCNTIRSCSGDNSKKEEVCNVSGWEKVLRVFPGQEYRFVLTPDDPGFAEYSLDFTAPYCKTGDSPCIANSSLLNSRDSVTGGSEPNQPNTIDSCADGTSGTYMTDESVENITVTDFNSSVFSVGDTVGVEAWVYCWATSADDHLGLVYTNDSNAVAPQWTLKQFIQGCPAAGFNRIAFNNFTLDNVEGNHSVRVYIQYNPTPDTAETCSDSSGGGGTYDDNDDLVFKVVDPSGPTISSPAFNETIVSQGSPVRFNVTVTDQSGVDSVTATFRYPNGTEVNRTLSRYYPPPGLTNPGFGYNNWTGWNWTFNRYSPGGGGGEDCNDNTYWGRKMLLTSPANNSYFEPSGDWERGNPTPVGGGGSNEATLTTGGDDLYHGQMISDPFTVPTYADQLTFWGHAYYLSAEDGQCDAGTRHSGTLNATTPNAWNEYVGFFVWVDGSGDTVGNTNTGDDYLIWQTYSNAIQGLGNNQNLNIDPTNFSVAISGYVGKTVYVTAEIVGTGGVDDALIQIDTVNFTSNLFYIDWIDTGRGGTYNATVVWANDTLGNSNFTVYTDVSFFVNATNSPPTKPTNIECNGLGNCNITVDTSVILNASGSTDPDDDNITYFIEAWLINTTTTPDLEAGTVQKIAAPNKVNKSVNLLFEDFEDASNWDDVSPGEDPANGCTGGFGTNFTNCDDNANDYDFGITTGGFAVSGSYMWVSDDWDTWASDRGIWYNFNPQTACNATLCEEVIISGYGAASSLDNANEYCRVWARNDTSTTSADIWYCGNGDACEFSNGGSAMPSALADWTYFETNFTTLLGLSSSTNASVHIGGRVPGPADQCYYEDINITGIYSINLNSTDSNTSYTNYNDVDGSRSGLTEIQVTIEVDSYNPSASAQQGSANPDLELGIWNGSSWITIGGFNLPGTYPGNGLNTTNYNFTQVTSNPSILSAWASSANQDLRIRGIYLDYYNSTLYDEINYTNVWVTLVGTDWTALGNHTETSTLSWNTTGIPDQTCIDLRSRAIDLNGSSLYSSYFTKGACLNISHGGPEIIDVTLQQIPIDFGALNPGVSYSPALAGNGFPMVVRIESTTNVDTNLSLKGTDFTAGALSFGVGNLSYSNSSGGIKNNLSTLYPLSPPYNNWIGMPGPKGGPSVNRPIFFWVTIPPGQGAGTYLSTVTVKVES